MGTNYQATVYRPRLENGQRFQDFVAVQLYQDGIVLVNFQSREYQYARGENLLGLEIKFDDRCRETGNLWIEISERTDPASPAWRASGINRGDAWLYGIGDYSEFWLFGVRWLQAWRGDHAPEIRENGTHTSRGFLLTRADAMRLHLRRWTWTQDAGEVEF